MFVQAQRYRRSELHRRYGGQSRGGISTPARHPIILLFTGESGIQYGYRDRWNEEGVFEYTGEGQRGDMEMVRGNAAILEHADRGKDLHLFEIEGGSFVRYVGQMVCVDFESRNAPDVDGRNRTAIMFKLVPMAAMPTPTVERSTRARSPFWRMPMDKLRSVARGAASPKGRRSREAKRSVYERSEAIRVYVLRRADGVCEACDTTAPFITASGRPYLEPHHIRRLSDGGPDDPAWVAGVCPNCHRRAHHGRDRGTLNGDLSKKIQFKEEPS